MLSGGPRLRALASVVLYAAAVTAAAEAPGVVKAVLENDVEGAEERCSYTRTVIEDGETKRERYHAGELVSAWELLAVDGREPTPSELRRYARKAKELDRRHPLEFDLREMVDPDHWQLQSESETQAVYEFRLRPDEELDARLVDKVRGELVVDKTRLQPVRITIENTEPAYVAPLVRVAQYAQELAFDWDPAVGASVLRERETRMRGRAVAFKVIERHKTVRYSDYQCEGAPGDLAG